MTIQRILFGNFGNGTFGIKTSTPGNDVSVLADDNDVAKRSFNSEWSNVVKVKAVGSVASDWEPYYTNGHGVAANPSGTILISLSYSQWRIAGQEVVTGLSDIPIWEDRIYNTATKTFYDDYCDGTVGGTGSAITSASFAGARSYFKGSSLFMEPGSGFGDISAVRNTAETDSAPGASAYPPYPPYPALPTKPALLPLRSVYILYANKMGTPS